MHSLIGRVDATWIWSAFLGERRLERLSKTVGRVGYLHLEPPAGLVYTCH